MVRSVNESSTRFDYEVDDYTGPSVLVKQFIDDDVSRLFVRIMAGLRIHTLKVMVVVLFVNYLTFVSLDMSVVFKVLLMLSLLK